MAQRARKPGFILGTVMVLLPIMAIVLISLVAVLRTGSGTSLRHHAQTSALCIAEAGLADALAQLEANPAWAAGFADKTLSGMSGTYTVTFNQSGAGFDDTQSVNNSDGTHPDSYRGADTVPPGATLLVVVARVAGAERRLEALVASSSISIELDTSLLTTGRIRFNGNVDISGIKALDDATAASADVQSNNNADQAVDMVSWTDPGGASLNIVGNVSTTGLGTIDLGTGTVTGTVGDDAASRPIPSVNIPAEVAGKSSSPTPAIVTGGTTTLGSGDHYLTGPITIDGDLFLDGGNLYVEGDVTINGSVSGDGSLYVNGNTELRGNAELNGVNKLALFSKGDVTLRGFDGTAYLESLATSDPTLNTWLTDAEWALQELETGTSGGWAGGDNNYLDYVSYILGGPAGFTPYGGRTMAAPWKIRDHLSTTVPAGPTRDFLIQRLDKIGRIYSGNNNVLGRPDTVAIADYLATGDTDGLWDAVNDLNDTALMDAVHNITSEIDYDHIGRAGFQGLVYTNGRFYAGNEISVRGAIVVNDDGSQTGPKTVDGVTLEPGDLYVADDCNITFVEQFFDGSGAPAGSGAPQVVLWMAR